MNRNEIINALKANRVVAYPTEAVFGLGCNPQSETAVKHLLQLKQRDINKGLILVAPTIEFFFPFLDLEKLTVEQFNRLTAYYATPTTWVVPCKKEVPLFLKGKFESLAVRLCSHPSVVALCEGCSFPLVSTSANVSGKNPCKTAEDVKKQFGKDFFVLKECVGEAKTPSQIRDLLTNQILRG